MKSLNDYHNSLPYRKTNDENIGSLVMKIMEMYGLKDKMIDFIVKKFWKETLGEQINRFTESIFIKKRILYIKLNSSALKMELSYAKSKLIEKMNSELKEDYIIDLILL